jgi:hypothetical protein
MCDTYFVSRFELDDDNMWSCFVVASTSEVLPHPYSVLTMETAGSFKILVSHMNTYNKTTRKAHHYVIYACLISVVRATRPSRPP